jgi:hypothetical protein
MLFHTAQTANHAKLTAQTDSSGENNGITARKYQAVVDDTHYWASFLKNAPASSSVSGRILSIPLGTVWTSPRLTFIMTGCWVRTPFPRFDILCTLVMVVIGALC